MFLSIINTILYTKVCDLNILITFLIKQFMLL
nr:MAG TPA: hypothetical protein [Caudoviricetes sp.]